MLVFTTLNPKVAQSVEVDAIILGARVISVSIFIKYVSNELTFRIKIRTKMFHRIFSFRLANIILYCKKMNALIIHNQTLN